MDPDQPVYDVRTMDDVVERSTAHSPHSDLQIFGHLR
jgi:hypothetical protein